MQLKKLVISALILGTMFPVFNASAESVNIFVGDNDGYGIGIADNGIAPSGYDFVGNDNRSATEISATNGAQQTDFYSANFTPLAQNFDITFALNDDLLSAIFEFDALGFQADQFGQFNLLFNGVLKTNGLNFQDGVLPTAIYSIALDALDLANANTAGQFVATIQRNNSFDAVAFDYFRLSGEDNSGPSAVPVPAAAWLFGTALLGFLGLRRKNTV